IPGLALYQPMGPEDCAAIVGRYGKGEVGPRLYLRVAMAASAVALPAPDINLPVGFSQVLRPGRDAVILSTGPVMLGEAMAAAELLAGEGVDAEVRNHPWLTAVPPASLDELRRKQLPL